MVVSIAARLLKYNDHADVVEVCVLLIKRFSAPLWFERLGNGG